MKKRVEFCKKNLFVLAVLSVCSVFAVLFLAAGPAHSAQTAVVATAEADYSGGAHSTISVDPVGGPRTAQNNLLPTISDITVAAYETYFYRIERFNKNNVTKFDINAPEEVKWQWSTEGDETNSNPHDLVFVNAEKAYLLRYGSNIAWIVNPSATVESDFKIGELDLSAYSFEGNPPGMHSGVIADGKFYITLQRLDAAWTPQTAYVAVFDVSKNEEIDTDKDLGDMLGIPLPIKNPGAIQYLAENSTVYVQGSGYFFGTPEYTGGIVSIDPDTYETNMVSDDGLPYGNITGMAIVSETKGYFVGYASWGHNTLYAFDPSTGTVGDAVSGLEDKNIAGMETGIYTDKNNMLWVCNQTDHRVDILNTTDDTIDESVSTNLNPLKVVFCSGESGGGSDGGGGGGSSGCFISTSAFGL